jgi:hypothetical protein
VFAAVSFLGPALYRIVVTDTELRIEGRWRPLRAVRIIGELESRGVEVKRDV